MLKLVKTNSKILHSLPIFAPLNFNYESTIYIQNCR
jgi:hypothetical protein